MTSITTPKGGQDLRYQAGLNAEAVVEATSGDPSPVQIALENTAPPVEASELAHLHRRLEAASQSVDSLDIAYTTIDSPVGALLLATTRTGLLRVAFEREGFDAVLQTLAERISPRVLRSPARLQDASRQVEQYFAGQRRHFELPVDLSLSSPFRQQVQLHLATIGYGRTESYAEVAKIVGNPKAVRAVGSACATNPLPLVLPCHRVLRSDGTLGGYRGGEEAKHTLLTLEAAA